MQLAVQSRTRLADACLATPHVRTCTCAEVTADASTGCARATIRARGGGRGGGCANARVTFCACRHGSGVAEGRRAKAAQRAAALIAQIDIIRASVCAAEALFASARVPKNAEAGAAGVPALRRRSSQQQLYGGAPRARAHTHTHTSWHVHHIAQHHGMPPAPCSAVPGRSPCRRRDAQERPAAAPRRGRRAGACRTGKPHALDTERAGGSLRGARSAGRAHTRAPARDGARRTWQSARTGRQRTAASRTPPALGTARAAAEPLPTWTRQRMCAPALRLSRPPPSPSQCSWPARVAPAGPQPSAAPPRHRPRPHPPRWRCAPGAPALGACWPAVAPAHAPRALRAAGPRRRATRAGLPSLLASSNCCRRGRPARQRRPSPRVRAARAARAWRSPRRRAPLACTRPASLWSRAITATAVCGTVAGKSSNPTWKRDAADTQGEGRHEAVHALVRRGRALAKRQDAARQQAAAHYKPAWGRRGRGGARAARHAAGRGGAAAAAGRGDGAPEQAAAKPQGAGGMRRARRRRRAGA